MISNLLEISKNVKSRRFWRKNVELVPQKGILYDFSVLNGALGSAYRASCLITFIVVPIKVPFLPQNVKPTAQITSIRQIYSKFLRLKYFCIILLHNKA